LSGNALCGTHDYRLYTIYTLRKLKVWVQDWLTDYPFLHGVDHDNRQS
jgi:hypothetical protein